MKTLTILLSLLCLVLSAQSQIQNTKDLLTKKWQIDTEAMKPILMKKLSEHADVNESNIGVALSTALDRIEGMTVEFKSDGTYVKKSPKGTSTSIWSLYDENKEIKITSTTTKEVKVLKITDISNVKLSILSSDGVTLVFRNL